MKNIGTITLETERLILRKLELDDAEAMYNNWCNDEEVTKYLPWSPHGQIEVTKELVEMWVNNYNNPHTYRWIIILKENNEPIGTIDIVNKDIPNKVFEIGHCYSKKSWGNGYATEALSKIISFLFEEVDIDVVIAKHYENNYASGKVMQKANMKYDGILRSRVIDKETKKRIGQVYYSITKEEYFKNNNI